MDIEVLQSTNGTFFNFMALGPSPGAYSGIQQTPDTKWVPSGKLFIFRYRDTETDGNNSYVEELNDNADVGGKVGVIHSEFSGEGTSQGIAPPGECGVFRAAKVHGTYGQDLI